MKDHGIFLKRGGVRIIVANATNDSCGGIAAGELKFPPQPFQTT
jgi:hypothetical protein